MGIDVARACRALKSSGVRRPSVCSTAWPFGRDRRLRTLMRRRLAVLEAKNAVVEFLFRAQAPLRDLRLLTLDDVRRGLEDPGSRRTIIGLCPNRNAIEHEVVSRSGSEIGGALDLALSELVRSGVVLQVSVSDIPSSDDVYIAVQHGRPPHYDTAELNRLVREGLGYGAQLRRRARRDTSTTSSRSYDL